VIVEFQRRVIGMAQPDGRVDPGGATWKRLAAAGAFEQLSPIGVGYYLYTTADKVWGTRESLESIRTAARRMREAFGMPRIVEIGIGDISYSDGRAMKPHHSHRSGRDVDIRPLRTDAKQLW
jgi:hypothetical protein